MNSRDTELLDRYLDQREETAFAQLVELYGGLVLGAAQRVTGEAEAAEDAAQNTFVTLAHKAPMLRGRKSLGGWLHHTAVNNARNILRSRRREEQKRARFGRSADSDPTGADDSWQAMQPVLDNSLASLSESDREALILRYYRGCSVQEVASTMDLSLVAAQKRLSRALEKLRKKLQGQSVALSTTGLTTGLGLWPSNSQAAATSSSTWASAASAARPTVSANSTSTFTQALTTMGNSKPAIAIAASVLLLGTGAIILSHSSDKGDSPAPSTAGAPPAEKKTLGDAGRPVSPMALRMRELKAQFGEDRFRQAQRITKLLNSGLDAEFDMAVAGLAPMTEEWLKSKQEKWGLDDPGRGRLATLVADEQIGKTQRLRDGFIALGEARSAATVEAVLLADQVTRGELDRADFEEAHERLSDIGSIAQIFINLGAAFRIDDYLIDEQFASSVEQVLPDPERETFRLDLANSIKRLEDRMLARIEPHVPDLSEEQRGELRAFAREIGNTDETVDRRLVAEFLTESQNDAWRRQEAPPEPPRELAGGAPASVQFHSTAADGQAVVTEMPDLRSGNGHQLPAYRWVEPMSLDRSEELARAMSRGGSIRVENMHQL
ncbi:MAG: sigma-70 family RNA polymerase sigma factor [Verrucomicrobiales bacterium]